MLTENITIKTKMKEPLDLILYLLKTPLFWVKACRKKEKNAFKSEDLDVSK